MNSKNNVTFSKDVLIIPNIEVEIDSIVNKLRANMQKILKRKGAVVGISGGIDSAVTLALAVRAFGADKVVGIMLPERDSSRDSKILAIELADKFGVQTLEEDITAALEGFGCYNRRDEAVAVVFPEYNPSEYKMKITLNQGGSGHNLPPLFLLTIIDSAGHSQSKIIPMKEFLQIMASTNFKQRCRMSMLYYHAERLHYAVIGTPNKHEVEQGFFVKFGDGGSDIMPIAHLYKTQVYQMARFLKIPKKIIDRTPTTDTYSAEQTQEEFFYQFPFNQMDLLWYGYENAIDIDAVASVMSMPPEEIKSIFTNFARKQRTTEYQRANPIFFEERKIISAI
ncbi:MAG: NAD(+) synthase [Lentimicrobiaceae bacterium]|jgi:NAD+ synthase